MAVCMSISVCARTLPSEKKNQYSGNLTGECFAAPTVLVKIICSSLCTCCVYIHPKANVDTAAKVIFDVTQKFASVSLDAPKFILCDINQCFLNKTLPSYSQYGTRSTRMNITIDLCYGTRRNAHKGKKLADVIKKVFLYYVSQSLALFLPSASENLTQDKLNNCLFFCFYVVSSLKKRTSSKMCMFPLTHSHGTSSSPLDTSPGKAALASHFRAH